MQNPLLPHHYPTTTPLLPHYYPSATALQPHIIAYVIHGTGKLCNIHLANWYNSITPEKDSDISDAWNGFSSPSLSNGFLHWWYVNVLYPGTNHSSWHMNQYSYQVLVSTVSISYITKHLWTITDLSHRRTEVFIYESFLNTYDDWFKRAWIFIVWGKELLSATEWIKLIASAYMNFYCVQALSRLGWSQN